MWALTMRKAPDARGHPVAAHRDREFVDRAFRRPDIQPHAPAKKRGRVEKAQDQVDIGYRQPGSAAPVAGGPGIGAGAVRTDAEQPVLVEPDDAAAARPDRAHRDLGHQIGVFVDHRLLVEHRPAALDHGDIEGGAAHVGAEDVVLAIGRAEEARAQHAADRPGIEHQ